MTAKTKFSDTIVTNAGRKMLIKVGAGKGMISYTRAGLYGQSVAGMDDYDIRNITKLTDEKITTAIKSVSTVVDNTITVSASFSNKTVTNDLEFNTLGWYAKLTTDKEETLIGITPTNGTLTLAAHSPDNISTESIDIDFNMAISNAAKVDMQVNQIGVVYKEDLQAEITKVNDGIDKKIANYYSKTEIDDKLKNLGGVKSVNGTKPDANGNVQINVDASQQITQQINNTTYNKSTVDSKLSTKADASSVYTKTDVDSRLNAKANSADVNKSLATKANSADVYTKKQVDDKLATKADKSTTYTKTDVDNKFTPVNNKQNDLENRVKYLEQNAIIGKTFTDETQAKNWTKEAANRLAVITNS